MKKIRNEQNAAIIALINGNKSFSGSAIQGLLTTKFSNMFEMRKILNSKADKLFVHSVEAEYAEFLRRTLGLDKPYFDPINFDHNALTALIHMDPKNAGLWVFLKCCIPSPPLPAKESYKNYMELISYIKDGAFGNKNKASLAYCLVEKMYRLAKTNYALKEQLDDEFSSKGILGKWLRSNGYKDELTALSSDASYEPWTTIPRLSIKTTVEAWKRAQLASNSDLDKQQEFIHALAETAETERSAFEELQHLNKQIDDLIAYKLGLSKVEIDFLAKFQLELRQFLSLQSHFQIAKLFENPNTPPKQMLQSIQATYDALLGGGGYDVFLLRMISHSAQLCAISNKHEDAIAIQLKPQRQEQYNEFLRLGAAFDEVKSAFTENTQEELTVLFSSNNRIVTELKAGNYERQLRGRPALKQFIENDCSAEGLDVFDIITQLKSMPYSTDSLLQQKNWLDNGIPSTSGKIRQHLLQRELHFKRLEGEAAADELVQRFGQLATIADKQEQIKEAEAIALDDLKQRKGLTKTNQALRLLIESNFTQLDGVGRNQYIASILQSAYPSFFTHLRQIDPDIAQALGISRFDKKLSIDLNRFNPNLLNKLYNKTQNPLWLVLKIMVNSNDKIQTCHYLAQCFQEGTFGNRLQYAPVLSLIRIANDNAREDQYPLLEQFFGPKSSIGAWLMHKAVSNKTFTLHDTAEDVMTLLSPAFRARLSKTSVAKAASTPTSVSSESLEGEDDDRSSLLMSQGAATIRIDQIKAMPSQIRKKSKAITEQQNTSMVAFINGDEELSGFNLQRVLKDNFNHIFEQDMGQLSVCSSEPQYASLVRIALGLNKTPFDPRNFNHNALSELIVIDPNNARLWVFLKCCIPSPPLAIKESYKNHMDLISYIKNGAFGNKDKAWLAYRVVEKNYRLAKTSYSLKEQLDDEFSSKGILGKWLRSNGYTEELTKLSNDASYKSTIVASAVPMNKSINLWKRRQLELSAGNDDTQKLIHSLVEVAETEHSTFEELEHLNEQITALIGYKLGLSRAEKDFLAKVQLELGGFLSLQSHLQMTTLFQNPNTDPKQMLQSVKATYDALLSGGGYDVFLLRMTSYRSKLDEIHHTYRETIDKKLNPTRLMLRDEAMVLHRAKMAMPQARSGDDLTRLFQSDNLIIQELKKGNYKNSLKTRPELERFIENNGSSEGFSQEDIAEVIAQLKDLPIDTDTFAQQQRWLEGGIPETSVKAHEHLAQRESLFKRVSDVADVANNLAQRFGQLTKIANNDEKIKEAEVVALDHLNKQNGLTKINQALRLLIGLKHYTQLYPERLEAIQQNQYAASILQNAYPSLFTHLRKSDPEIAYALGISRFDKKLSIDLTRFNSNLLNKLYNKTHDPLWLVLKLMVNPQDKIRTCHHLAQCFQEGAFGEPMHYEPVLNLISIANDNATATEHARLEQFFGPQSTIGAWLINKAVSENISSEYNSPQKVMTLLSPSLRARLSSAPSPLLNDTATQAQAPRGVAATIHQTKVAPVNGQTIVRLQMLFSTLSQREETKNSTLVKKVVELLNSGSSLKTIQDLMQSMAKERKDRNLSKFSGLGFHARNPHVVQPLYDFIAKQGQAFKIDDVFCASMEKLVDPIPSTSTLAAEAYRVLENLNLSCQQHCKRHTGIKLIQSQLIKNIKDPNASLLAIQEIAKHRVNSSWSKSHFFAAGRDKFVQELYVILSQYNAQKPEETIGKLSTLFASNTNKVTRRPVA